MLQCLHHTLVLSRPNNTTSPESQPIAILFPRTETQSKRRAAWYCRGSQNQGRPSNVSQPSLSYPRPAKRASGRNGPTILTSMGMTPAFVSRPLSSGRTEICHMLHGVLMMAMHCNVSRFQIRIVVGKETVTSLFESAVEAKEWKLMPWWCSGTHCIPPLSRSQRNIEDPVEHANFFPFGKKMAALRRMNRFGKIFTSRQAPEMVSHTTMILA